MIPRRPRSTLCPCTTLFRSCGKSVVVAANKADNSNGEAGAADFAGLGFDEIFPVSAIHDRGIEALIDRKSTRLNSSHSQISYAVFCLNRKLVCRLLLDKKYY